MGSILLRLPITPYYSLLLLAVSLRLPLSATCLSLLLNPHPQVPEKDDLDLDPEYLSLKVLDHSHMDHDYKLESSVDPDFVQKRAGFSQAAEHIDVKIPKSGAIAEAEEKAEAAQGGVEEAKAKSDAEKAKAQARLAKAEEALRAVRKRVCQRELGVAEWGDDKVGGRGYGVVVRLVKVCWGLSALTRSRAALGARGARRFVIIACLPPSASCFPPSAAHHSPPDARLPYLVPHASRLVKEGSPAYSAGVKKTMAATSVNKTVVKTEDELYSLFSEGSVITFVPKVSGWGVYCYDFLLLPSTS